MHFIRTRISIQKYMIVSRDEMTTPEPYVEMLVVMVERNTHHHNIGLGWQCIIYFFTVTNIQYDYPYFCKLANERLLGTR